MRAAALRTLSYTSNLASSALRCVVDGMLAWVGSATRLAATSGLVLRLRRVTPQLVPHLLNQVPFSTRTQEGEYIETDGPCRLHFTYGDDEPLKGKAMYMIRASDKPMDVDKVRAGVCELNSALSIHLATLTRSFSYVVHALPRSVPP